MKVLIVAPSRSGGTSLLKWISSELGIKQISEPLGKWRKENKFENFWQQDNVCVKLHPDDCEIDIQNNFDKVIILTRSNLFEQAISLVNAEKTKLWHSRYSIDNKWLEENAFQIKHAVSTVELWNNMCKKWVTGTNICITYEGIYDKINNDREIVKDYLGINIFNNEWILDIKNRYRSSENLKLI